MSSTATGIQKWMSLTMARQREWGVGGTGNGIMAAGRCVG